jgi:hypothetical protein
MGGADTQVLACASALPISVRETSKLGQKKAVRGKTAMDGTECCPDVTNVIVDFTLDGTDYFYQSCSWKRSEVVNTMVDCLHRTEQDNSTQCAQFCGSFRDILPHVYGTFSCVSLLCCLGVFITYYTFPRLQQSGYSSKVFLRRYTNTLSVDVQIRG